MIAEHIADLFRGRMDVLAVGSDDGFQPEYTTPTAARIESEHLSGGRCLGFYVLDADNTCNCTAADFDNKPHNPDLQWREKAERLCLLLRNLDLDPLVELSQSGAGVHVWLFFSEPIAAWIVRAWWREVFRKLGDNAPEIFPKQEKLSGKGIGNLIRYPLWGESCFVEIEDDWEPLDAGTALESVRRTNEGSLKMIAWQLGCPELRPESPIHSDDEGGLPGRVKDRIEAHPTSLLARRWYGDTTGMNDGSKSALVLSIACELVRTYVPTPEVEAAVRYWCDRFGYEKGLRETWVRDTVRKSYDFVLSRTEAKSRTSVTAWEACLEYTQRLRTGAPLILPSGVPSLDDSVEGAGYGEMVVIAALPGHGKSAVAMQWLDNATELGSSCLILSEEMSRFALAKRCIQFLSNVPEDDWVGRIDEVDRHINRHYAKRGKLHIVECAGTIDRAEELIDQYCGIHGVSVVAVDYLTMLGSRGHASRYEAVSDVSRRLKQAAQRNNCVLLALCQLNRKVMERKNFIPQNSDLRESGQIEQDADLIIHLQWVVKLDPHYRDAKEFRMFITKRRNGGIKRPVVKTTFDGERQRIEYAEAIDQTADNFSFAGSAS